MENPSIPAGAGSGHLFTQSISFPKDNCSLQKMKFTDNPGAKAISLLHISPENMLSVSRAQAK